jgi:hypothetical protein
MGLVGVERELVAHTLYAMHNIKLQKRTNPRNKTKFLNIFSVSI